ncbi:hypothetical protein PENTCL1PPCAC_27439, partial [Pristionchus entomophagus]
SILILEDEYVIDIAPPAPPHGTNMNAQPASALPSAPLEEDSSRKNSDAQSTPIATTSAPKIPPVISPPPPQPILNPLAYQQPTIIVVPCSHSLNAPKKAYFTLLESNKRYKVLGLTVIIIVAVVCLCI